MRCQRALARAAFARGEDDNVHESNPSGDSATNLSRLMILPYGDSYVWTL
jgi:hypothetical protein